MVQRCLEIVFGGLGGYKSLSNAQQGHSHLTDISTDTVFWSSTKKLGGLSKYTDMHQP